jgi:hypothetical protein
MEDSTTAASSPARCCATPSTSSKTASAPGASRWDQLFKTEKAHFGTLAEINLEG